MLKSIDVMTYDELTTNVREQPIWAVARLLTLTARVAELELGIQDIAVLLKIDDEPDDPQAQQTKDFMADSV